MVVWNIQALLDWFILHIDIKRAKLPSSPAIHDMCSLEPGGYGPVIRMKEGNRTNRQTIKHENKTCRLSSSPLSCQKQRKIVRICTLPLLQTEQPGNTNIPKFNPKAKGIKETHAIGRYH
jgi:hypothetical protein